jgi:hypothetical protein
MNTTIAFAQRVCRIGLFWSALLSLPVVAQNIPNGQGLRVNGFGTLGILHDATDFGGSFRRELSQPIPAPGTHVRTDSRLGVQLNYAVNPQWEMVGQVVLKDRASPYPASDAVEWAFLAYRPRPDISLRLGRTSPDLFLLSDYRNVGFAYAAARPAIDFYSHLALAVLDGADLSKTWMLDDVQWRAKVFAGKSTYHATGMQAGTVQGNVRDLVGLMLAREHDGLLLRATLAKSRINFNIAGVSDFQLGLDSLAVVPASEVAAQAAELRRNILSGDKSVIYASMGAAYERNAWLLNAEVLSTRSEHVQLAVNAGYVMVGRRFGNVTLHSTVGRARTRLAAMSTPQWASALAPYLGPNLAQQAQALGSLSTDLVNSVRVDQRTLSLGLRWDFHPRMALKAQWDQTHVQPNGVVLWSGRESGGRANAYSVTLDFVF